MQRADPTEAGGTQSIGRALDLLRIAARFGEAGARLGELAAEAELAPATARRILKFLAAQRMVRQDAATRRYRLGPLAFELGLATDYHRRLVGACRPLLRRLSERTEDTIYLALRSGLHTVCVDQIEASFPVRAATMRIGDRLPLGVGAGSLALLAGMREAEAERLVAAVEGELAAYGLTVADVLAAVGRARASGIGVSAERVNPEISGIGTVLPNPGGEPFTIVAVGSVTSRIMGPRFAGLCDILREEVARFADSGALVPV